MDQMNVFQTFEWAERFIFLLIYFQIVTLDTAKGQKLLCRQTWSTPCVQNLCALSLFLNKKYEKSLCEESDEWMLTRSQHRVHAWTWKPSRWEGCCFPQSHVRIELLFRSLVERHMLVAGLWLADVAAYQQPKVKGKMYCATAGKWLSSWLSVQSRRVQSEFTVKQLFKY